MAAGAAGEAFSGGAVCVLPRHAKSRKELRRSVLITRAQYTPVHSGGQHRPRKNHSAHWGACAGRAVPRDANLRRPGPRQARRHRPGQGRQVSGAAPQPSRRIGVHPAPGPTSGLPALRRVDPFARPPNRGPGRFGIVLTVARQANACGWPARRSNTCEARSGLTRSVRRSKLSRSADRSRSSHSRSVSIVAICFWQPIVACHPTCGINVCVTH